MQSQKIIIKNIKNLINIQSRYSQKNSVDNNSIIVSLTSYPARIETVNQTIESILYQTKKPYKVILWLAPEQFPNKEQDLPKQLLDLIPQGLTIDWYHDIKSYKKLIPTLIKYPNDIIVTADDDILYEKEWLEKLYISYLNNPNYIHCHRAHKIQLDEKNRIKEYRKWKKHIFNVSPTFLNFKTTGGGVLYPPYSLHKDVFNEEKFMKLSPTGDDIWFWAMAVLNNKKINIVKNNIQELNIIDGSQKETLYSINKEQNNIQIYNILKEYPELKSLIKKEYIHSKYFLKYFLGKIFSIKNEQSENKKIYKVITLLGIKIKLRNRKKEQQ